MKAGWSRRAVLALPLAAGADTRTHPSEQQNFRDRATEWVLLRLTDPERGNAFLPASPCTAIDTGNRLLVLASDRTGQPQIYRYDLRSGVSEQWTDGSAVHPHLFCLISRNRLLYIDGPHLMLTEKKPREIYAAASGWSLGGSLDVDDRGRLAAFAEHQGDTWRLRLAPLTQRGRASTLGEFKSPIRKVVFRPRSSELLYLAAEGLHLVDRSGRSRRLELPEGNIGDALWSADGSMLFFLHTAPATRKVELRQYSFAEQKEAPIADTSQFVSFARNRDSSVFLGVSGSKGSPYLLLLVRSVKRELAVAEHAATDPAGVVAFFSPDSQRVYYHSNLQGRSAVYSLGLERFVEKTEESIDR
jgi:hypothetical protein